MKDFAHTISIEQALDKSQLDRLGYERRAVLFYRGNFEIFREKKKGLFCSAKVPGDKIIKAFDLARKWRDEGKTVISGFHSPIEKEYLDILLRGSQPIIICSARGIQKMRIPREWKEAFDQGRLLILSPFPDNVRRATKDTADQRNRLVAAMADEVHIIHAEPGGQIATLVIEIRTWTKTKLIV